MYIRVIVIEEIMNLEEKTWQELEVGDREVGVM